jgi:hypothetical protein
VAPENVHLVVVGSGTISDVIIEAILNVMRGQIVGVIDAVLRDTIKSVVPSIVNESIKVAAGDGLIELGTLVEYFDHIGLDVTTPLPLSVS